MINNLEPALDIEKPIPDDQQEDESDINGPISFRDSMVLNSDWTIETIYGQIKKGNIDLQPNFQRRVAWDDVRKGRLIESILVGMPIPNIVLAEAKNQRNRFIVIDGKQRLAAICDFIENKFTLSGLDIRPELNGSKFRDLISDDIANLENATLRSSVIRNWQDENFLYIIFYRLNSGSLPLSPQELRKALIGGKLLNLIESYLATSKPFHALFGIMLDKRMRDSELVLRFLTFDRGLEHYRGDFRRFLDEATTYYEEDWASREAEAKASLERLDRSLETAYFLFKNDAYKKWLGDRYERVINRAIFDCISRFFAEELVRDRITGREIGVVDDFKTVCEQSRFRESIERTTKSLSSTLYRIDTWGEMLAGRLGLQYHRDTHRIV